MKWQAEIKAARSIQIDRGELPQADLPGVRLQMQVPHLLKDNSGSHVNPHRQTTAAAEAIRSVETTDAAPGRIMEDNGLRRKVLPSFGQVQLLHNLPTLSDGLASC